MLQAGHNSVSDRLQRNRPQLVEVNLRVNLIIDLTDNGYVVASQDVKTQRKLLHTRLHGVNALVALVQNDVGGLVVAAQNAHYAAPIVCNDRNGSVNKVGKACVRGHAQKGRPGLGL